MYSSFEQFVRPPSRSAGAHRRRYKFAPLERRLARPLPSAKGGPPLLISPPAPGGINLQFLSHSSSALEVPDTRAI